MKKVTVIFIVVATITILIYDLYAYIKGGSEATISRIILNAAKEWPIINTAFSILLGHLLWPQVVYKERE